MPRLQLLALYSCGPLTFLGYSNSLNQRPNAASESSEVETHNETVIEPRQKFGRFQVPNSLQFKIHDLLSPLRGGAVVGEQGFQSAAMCNLAS